MPQKHTDRAALGHAHGNPTDSRKTYLLPRTHPNQQASTLALHSPDAAARKSMVAAKTVAAIRLGPFTVNGIIGSGSLVRRPALQTDRSLHADGQCHALEKQQLR